MPLSGFELSISSYQYYPTQEDIAKAMYFNSVYISASDNSGRAAVSNFKGNLLQGFTEDHHAFASVFADGFAFWWYALLNLLYSEQCFGHAMSFEIM